MKCILALVALLWLAGCATPQLPATAGAPTLAQNPDRLLVVTLRNPLAPGLRAAGSTWRGWDWEGQYRLTASVERATREIAEAHALNAVDAWPIRVLDVHCVVFALDPLQSREAVLRQLRADPRVESAQPLNQFQSLAAGYDDSQRDLQGSLETMQLEAAHRWSQGRGVRVAVIDTGVDVQHPELKGRIGAEHDFVLQPGAVPHRERHGTAVAGIIGARANNGEGIVGVAPAAELLVLKACWPLSAGTAEATCNSFTLARALAAAIDLDADILNLSLAGPADPLLSRMVAVAIARGSLVIAAVPQAWTRGGRSIFPASVPGVIAVRASETTGASDGVVPAPGQHVLAPAPGGSYDFQSGSSMAAAHVSGVAALLREQRPRLSPVELEPLLLEAANGAAHRPGLNACRALARLLHREGCADSGTGQPLAARP